MNLPNETPSANRFTIGIFGRTNAGKSSLINALTEQEVAVTSPIAGTTTDPVKKSMELLPIGPLVIIDTPGIDDEGELGPARIEKAYEVLRRCHLVILVLDAAEGADAFGETEARFIRQLKKRDIFCIIALNKCGKIPEINKLRNAGTNLRALSALLNRSTDLNELKESLVQSKRIRAIAKEIAEKSSVPIILTDAQEGIGIEELKKAIINNAHIPNEETLLTDGIVKSGDTVVLVTPIDQSAPKGRMILPQQQVLRDILDRDAYALVTKETTLAQALRSLSSPPDIVITDSQAFAKVAPLVPEEIPLTSFSILFARQKGDLEKELAAIEALADLEDGDTVLIAEGCTHHRQDDDIATVKIPRLIRGICPGVEFEWYAGADFPVELRKYKLIVHCGACMLNRREMQYRIDYALSQGIPITNYGMVIAYCTGLLPRAVRPFGLEINDRKEQKHEL